MKPYAIAIVGMAGTGKSEITKHITNKLNIESIYFGGIVIEEVKARGLEVNPINENNIRQDLRLKEGMDVMAKRSLPKILEQLEAGNSVLLDSIYSYREYLTLSEKLGDSLVVIAVHAARYQREERIAVRPVRPMTATELLQRDKNEIETVEKAGPIAIADYHLLNDSTLEDLYPEVDQILEKIIKSNSS